MKKKVSVGFVFAMILVLLTVAALATGLLLSPRASATRIADEALEKNCGVTAEMQTFFAREQKELDDGTIQITYTGVGEMEYVLGTYTALVKNGRAETTWSHDGEDVSGGYEAEAWGSEQLKQMIIDAQREETKQAYMDKAAEIAGRNDPRTEEDRSTEAIAPDDDLIRSREAAKTAALNARKLSEDEMIAIAREFIISNYALSEGQIARLDENLYTNSFEANENCWYEMVNGKPCFQVEYLMYEEYTTEQMDRNESAGRADQDGYYNVFVNVETGEIEDYEYNSALAGIG